MNEPTIQFVSPPKKWKNSPVVKRVEGKRQYIETGPTSHFKHWLRELHEALPGDLIPLQWIPEYVHVTRGAVKKRVNTGRLTVFTFVVVELKSTMLGSTKYRETRRTFDFASISECDQWRGEIIDRMNEEDQAELLRDNQRRQR